MLYRKRRQVPPALVAAAAAVVALPAGFLIGRASAPSPTLKDLLRPADAVVRAAQGGLEIVALEYPRALAGATASRDAALKAVRDALDGLETRSDVLDVVAPDANRAAREQLETLSGLIGALAPQARVEAQLERARAALASLRPRL
jgi:hypothetical protein